MEPRKLRYHLRYQVLPGRGTGRVARDLARFCLRHGIEEVALFYAAEEWNNGLLSRREEDLWLEAVRKAKGILEERGIEVSLNPWMTVLHTARGRVFPRDRSFGPMVSPTGLASTACASFADQGFREYLEAQYARFAEMGFRVLWVEDDFRYHNHAPLDWGGGFEPQIIERFRARAGCTADREAILRAILAPGEPHPWRRLWLETWRDIQIEVASGLARAVGSSSPRPSKLGLMSSHPAVHAVEGRDWGKLFHALSIGGEVAHRPHFASYAEGPGRALASAITMLDVQRTLRESRWEVSPEIENFPFTSWTKSDSLTWAQMALCMVQGSDALLLDLFPFSGNRASEEPAIGRLLGASRPALEWIARELPRNLEPQGIGAPWKQDAQLHVRTQRGESLAELDATFAEVSRLLLPYGVPVTCGQQSVNAIFGSLAWAFSDQELRGMLSGGLLVDGKSASILQERGYGELLGVDVKVRLERDASAYAVEEVTAKESGVREGFFSNTNLLSAVYALEPLPGAVEWTRIIAPDRPPRGSRIGAGLVCFRNRSGGRVAVFAAESPGGLPPSFQRQLMTHRLARFLGFDGLLVSEAPHLLPMCFRAPEGTPGPRNVVVVVNGNPDPARPVLTVPGVPASGVDATLLAPLDKPRSARVTVSHGENDQTTIDVRSKVPYLGYLVVRW